MSPLALSLHFLQAQPDGRLVALARAGHEPAFEALVRRYRGELLSYCRRLQPQTGGAEDALQQTLLQAWRALSTGAEVRDVRPWLYRIAHNVTVNSLRVHVAVPQEIPDAPGRHGVDELVQQRLEARAALAGMAALPEVQRQAFISTALDGASHDEIASNLGLSSGAVRGLIYRARATLRAAAAAFTPSPVLHWAIRRAESRPGAPIAEMLAGGSGAGVAAVIAKGGAVLTLAGAVAGAGGVILAPTPSHRHHGRSPAELAASPAGLRSAQSPPEIPPAAARLAAATNGVAHEPPASQGANHRGASLAGAPKGHARTSGGDDHGGSTGGSRGGDGGSGRGSDSGSAGGSRPGSDDGSTASAASRSGPDGSSGSAQRTDGGSRGGSPTNSGSDGGPSSSSGTSDGSGTSGGSGTASGGSGSDGGQVVTAQTASGGGSSSDGGSPSGSDGSSGSGDPTTTGTTH